MKTAYPVDWQDRLRKLFQNSEDWAKTKQRMKEREVSHSLDAVVEDDFDLLGVNHFYNLFDLEFSVLCPVTVNPGSEEGKKLKRAMLGYAQAVKELRDPLSHPVEHEFSYADAFRLIDSARRFLACLNLRQANTLEGLVGQLSGRGRKLNPVLIPLAVASVFILGLVLAFHLSRRPSSPATGGQGKSAQSVIPKMATRRTAAFSFSETLQAAVPPPSPRESLPLKNEAKGFYSEGWKRMRRLDYIGARDSFEKAIAVQPDNALVHVSLASALSGLGFDAKVKSEAEEASHLIGNLSAKDRLWVEAWNDDVQHEWGKAAKDYYLLWTQFPDNLEYGLRLVAAETEAGEAKHALSNIERLRQQPGAKDDARVDLAEAETHNALSQFGQARVAALGAQAKGRAASDRQVVAQARLSEGDALWGLGLNEEAKAAFRDALRIFADSQDFMGVNDSHMRLIDLAYEQGDELEAARLYEELRASYESQGNESGIASALNGHAKVLGELGDALNAKRMFEEALWIRRTIGDKIAVAATLSDYGDLLDQLGNVAAANAKYQESLTLFTESGDHGGAVQALSDIAGVLWERGELGSARSKYLESLAIFKQIGDRTSYAESLLELGDVNLDEGELAQAEAHYRESLALSEKAVERITEAHGFLDLAELALEERKPLAKVLDEGQHAAEVFRRANAPVDEARAHNVLATALLAQGELVKARKEVDLALSLASKTGSLGNRIASTITSSRILADSGDLITAKRTALTAVNEAVAAGIVRYQFDARLALGEIEMKAGDTASGRADLAQLEKDARAKGFGLVAAKAARAPTPGEAVK